MSETDMPKSTKEVQPVIALDKDHGLLYMYNVQLEFVGNGINYMASIVYDRTKKTVQMRGRMRYDESGNKTVFHDKELPYSEKLVAELQEKIKKVPRDLVKKTPNLFRYTQASNELFFGLDESIEDIVKKLNATDMFFIGSMENDK